jgi:1-aminocyclopropane-1-carboxylate deaminase/D-cysteine desulfhydrase-like pyridoxal-dependent ACC family enzyme
MPGTTICARQPRVRLVHLPTPLEEAPALSAELGIDLLIKREDLAGLCVGGNKSRLMEFALGALRARGIDTLVAHAADQSNKLRDIAAAAARCGMRAVLLVPGDAQIPGAPPQGNRLLFDVLGADVRNVGSGLDDAAVLAAEEAVRDELARAGRRVAILDRRLDYGVDATIAYVDAAEELRGQLLASGRGEAMAVFVAAGAGMTTAGLALGLKHLGAPARVHGVCIARPAAGLADDIVSHAARAAAQLQIETRLVPGDVALEDDVLAPGYGIVTPEIAAVVRRVARAHGLVLDPVYNAKVARCLFRRVESGAVPRGATVVLMNTGGAPAIYAHAGALAPARG